MSFWERIVSLFSGPRVIAPKAWKGVIEHHANVVQSTLGLRLKKDVTVEVVSPTAFRQSKTLGREVGVVVDDGLEIVGLCYPRGRLIKLVTDRQGSVVGPVVQHEIAHALAMQHGKDDPKITHSPREWANKVWGWV